MWNKDNRKESKSQQENQPQEDKKEEIKEEAEDETPKEISILYSDYLKLTEAAEKEKKEKEEWKNKAYLAYADTANLRKSLEADHRNALRYRAQGFIENLLPALDSMYLALKVEPNGQEAKNYQQGFQFIYNQIQAALESEGVNEILPKIGDEFDPNTMHAMEVEEVEGDPNKVLLVMRKGYRLHEKLISPAMVKVSKKKEEKTEPAENAEQDKENEANKA